MEQHAELARHRDQRTFARLLPTSFTQAQAPSFQHAVWGILSYHVMRALHQQTPQAAISGFGDAELRVTLSTLARLRTRCRRLKVRC
jgi:hypothetical protein